MAIVGRLKSYLDKNGVDYHILYHQRVYTAQEVAAAQHVSGKELAKVVMIKVGSEPAMMVLPASFMVDMDKLKKLFHGKRVKLAREEEFQGLFPDCEIGAMPPFGNLYELEVYVDTVLAEQSHIVFQAGSHVETIKMAYKDFVNLVQPHVVDFATYR
ncbi:MAG: YbaK/EbsC family protein [Syntrophobacterales bacterium]|nr:MAG: YbaK/EbsC family protein [Syntrophobacterales bacterium]